MLRNGCHCSALFNCDMRAFTHAIKAKHAEQGYQHRVKHQKLWLFSCTCARFHPESKTTEVGVNNYPQITCLTQHIELFISEYREQSTSIYFTVFLEAAVASSLWESSSSSIDVQSVSVSCPHSPSSSSSSWSEAFKSSPSLSSVSLLSSQEGSFSEV